MEGSQEINFDSYSSIKACRAERSRLDLNIAHHFLLTKPPGGSIDDYA